MTKRKDKDEPRLPFPTRELRIGDRTVEEYIIPAEKKAAVLKQLFPFSKPPAMDEQKFDLHEGKLFTVREFRVTREDGENYLVSPYYPSGGGTVIDWMPPAMAGQS